MTTDSPVVVLFNSDGYEVNVKPNVSIPAGTTAILAAGTDGTNSRFISVDSSGRQVVVGAGSAGTPTGGVITIQGDPSGTPLPISGSVSVSNPSIGSTGAAIPGSATQIGASDGTNLQVPRVFDADTGGGTQYVLGVNLRLSSSGGSAEFGTASNPIRIDPTGTTTQPISAASLPLPTGAATEATLATRLADATFTARINTLGQKTMANSTPVVLASDQTVIPVSQSGTWTVQPGNTANTTPWLITISQGGNAATVTGANALKVDGSAVTQPVSGTVAATQSGAWTVTANAGTGNFIVIGTASDNTTNSTAKLPVLPARANTSAPTWTDGNQVPLSVDTAGALRITGSISASNASIGINGAAIPTSSTQTGGTDGTNLQPFRVFDVDTGAGTQYVQGVSLRLSSSGGSVEFGTATNPIRIDPTGTTTQPVSGTVTANAGTGNFTVVQSTASNLRVQTASESATGAATPATANLAGGAVTTAAPTYTNGNLGALSLTTSGLLRVDGSGATQPISGTVAATQSGTWNITNISGTISLPTGAATEASLAKLTLTQGSTTSGQSGTLMQGAVTTAAPTYTTAQTNPLSLTTAGALRIDGSAVTQPVSGTVTANAGTGNFTVVQSTASNLRSQTSSESNTGAAVPTQASMSGGTDGTNLRAFSVDASGRQIVIGAAADGAAVTGNPVLIAGQDGTNAQSILTDTTGRQVMVGAAADGAAVAGNPVLMAGQDGTNAQSLLTDTTGRQVMVGAAADGAAVTGNPILIGGQDGTNAQSMLTDTTGRPVVVGAGAAGAPVGGILSTQVPDTTGSGTLNALNATASIALAGTAGASLQLSAGTLIGTIVPEISYDGGTTWSISLFQDPTNAVFSSSITFSASNGANAQTIIVPAGASNARVRVSLFTSGTASANVRSTTLGNIVPSLLTHTINTTSHALGKITTAATTQVAIRQTTFTEQSSNAQRSVSSASASDTSAGTGARTIKITYYDASFAGPFTVTLTMNGTANVNTGVTNICFVEKIEVVTVGSGGSNAGIISLFAATAGGGGTIATIAANDNRTFWAHHYIPSGKNCYITQMHGANSDGTNGTLYVLKAKSLNANSAELEFSGVIDGGGQVNQGVTTYQTPISVVGPARVVLYGTPDSAGSTTNRGYFSYYDL